jgi:iron complex transport system substrate-binding protein
MLSAVAVSGLVAPGKASRAAPAPMPLSNEQSKRLATIGGAVTETIYALGLADRIVAVDSTSLYPPAALREKQNLGYMRALSAESVLSVAPSAILIIDGAGPPQVVDQLKDSPIPVVPVDGTSSAEAVVARARFIGQALGVPARGEELASKVEQGFARLAAARGAITRRARVMFILSLRAGRPLAAGRETAADAMITLTGAENALPGFTGYKALTDEAVIQAAPDIILMMDGAEGPIEPDTVLAMAAFRATPAGRAKVVISVDGETLLGFGPRTPETALALAQRFATFAR